MHNTNPSIKLVVVGKPKPLVQFTFDGKTTQAVGEPLINQFLQYEFHLTLPQLKGRHCGMTLSYTTKSTIQNTSPIHGNTTIYVDGKMQKY